MHTASFLKQQSVQFPAEQNRGDCPPWCSHLHTDEGGLPAGKKDETFTATPLVPCLDECYHHLYS